MSGNYAAMRWGAEDDGARLVVADYPRRGRRLWLFLAVVVVLGLFGMVLMMHSVSQASPV